MRNVGQPEMKVLISPISLEEAQAVYLGGADIIDIKNIKEGSLGASFPSVIRSVVEGIAGSNITFSATLGDLPYKPGTAALAALGAVVSGARYVKAGLYGTRTREEAAEVMQAVRKACKDYDAGTTVVAAGYADYRRFGGLDPLTIVAAASDANADLVMLDTAIKDGKTLFDALSLDELRAFVLAAKAASMQTALAGSIGFDDIRTIRALGADVIGVRGAVCSSRDRTTSIDADLVRSFVAGCRFSEAAE